MSPSPRRSPRFARFLGTGALIGVVAAVTIVLLRGSAVDSPGLLFLYLAIVLAGLGALLAGAVAVVLDRPDRRR